MSTFGDNVKRVRESRGMSQDELAKKAGYSGRSTISCIETGKRDCPQKQIFAIANALGVTPGELLESNENSAPHDKRKALIQKIERLFESHPLRQMPNIWKTALQRGMVLKPHYRAEFLCF